MRRRSYPTLPRSLTLVALVPCALAASASGQVARAPDARTASADAQVVGEWQRLASADGLPHDSVRALCRFGDQLWVGTDSGLALLEHGQWRSWKVADGLTWPVVSAIAVDPQTRDVWLGTWGGGLARFSGGRFDRFDQFNSGLAGDLVFDVAVAGRTVWAATNGGLSAFDWIDGTWDLFLERRADGPELAVTGVAVLDGAVHAATWCDALWSIAPEADIGEQRLAPRTAAGAELGQGELVLGLEAANGELWCLTGTNLWRRAAGGAWERRAIPAGERDDDWCFGVSESGEVWLGARDGLLCLPAWSSALWLTYDFSGADGAHEARVRALTAGRAAQSAALSATFPAARARALALGGGQVWVGTAGGLLRAGARQPWSALAAATEGPGGAPREDGARPASQTDAQRPTAPEAGNTPRPELAFGVLGPFTRTAFLPGAERATFVRPRAELVAAQVAAEQLWRPAAGGAGRRIGIWNTSFQLDPYAWTLVEDDLIDIIVHHAPQAFIGCVLPDDRITKAATMVTELPLLNVCTDPPSVDELASPWIFRCPIDDPREHARLLDLAFETLGCRKPAVLWTKDVYADLRLTWWRDRAAERHAARVAELWSPPRGGDPSALLAQLAELDCDLLLTWQDDRTTAELVRRMRAQGGRQVVLGSEQIVTDLFLELAGDEVGAVLAPAPCDHRRRTAERARFLEQYASGRYRGGAHGGPLPLAWMSYDAVGHLTDALARGGEQPEGLRRALQASSASRSARVVEGRWQLEAPADR